MAKKAVPLKKEKIDEVSEDIDKLSEDLGELRVLLTAKREKNKKRIRRLDRKINELPV